MPAELVDSFLLQPAASLQSGGTDQLVYLTYGLANPPVLVGEQQASEYERQTGGVVHIEVKGRIVLTSARARELMHLLHGYLQAMEGEVGQP